MLKLIIFEMLSKRVYHTYKNDVKYYNHYVRIVSHISEVYRHIHIHIYLIHHLFDICSVNYRIGRMDTALDDEWLGGCNDIEPAVNHWNDAISRDRGCGCGVFHYAWKAFQWMEISLLTLWYSLCHADVIKWKHFPRYWPFVRGIHWSPVNYPHKGQWRGALMFSLICVWINGWVNKHEAIAPIMTSLQC